MHALFRLPFAVQGQKPLLRLHKQPQSKGKASQRGKGIKVHKGKAASKPCLFRGKENKATGFEKGSGDKKAKQGEKTGTYTLQQAAFEI